jgi:hypothetical protein
VQPPACPKNPPPKQEEGGFAYAFISTICNNENAMVNNFPVMCNASKPIIALKYKICIALSIWIPLELWNVLLIQFA